MGALRAEIVSCRIDEIPDTPDLRVRFDATSGTPDGMVSLLRDMQLYGYSYRPPSALPEEAVHVRGFPDPPGTIELLPPSDTGATAQPAPPPVAGVPLDDVPTELIFENLLLAKGLELTVAAGSLDSLVSKSVETPLGLATVTDVRAEGPAVTVIVSFEWLDWLRTPSGWLPRGSLLSGLAAGELSPTYAELSFVPGQGSAQSLKFRVPVAKRSGPVKLTLDQFGVFYVQQIRLSGIREACATSS